MGRLADADAEDAGRLDRQVLLADVDVVRLSEPGEIGTVVDDEWHAHPPRYLTSLLQDRQELAVGERLLAELDDVDAAAHRRPEERLQVGACSGDQAEAAMQCRSYPPATGRATTSVSPSSSATSP